MADLIFCFIGPYDLSQSLGIPGQVDHPLIENTVKDIIRKCREKNITVGNFNDTVTTAKKWISLGIKYISYSVDVGIFADGCKAVVRELKN